MAWINRGKIRDRLVPGSRKIVTYTIPDDISPREALEAHRCIVALTDPEILKNLSGKALRAGIRLVVSAPRKDRYEVLKAVVSMTSERRPLTMVDDLLELGLEVCKKRLKASQHRQAEMGLEMWARYFAEIGVQTVDKVTHDVVESYPEWRAWHRAPGDRRTSQVSSRVVHQDLRFLEITLRAAKRDGLIEDDTQCEDVRVEKVEKIVEALDAEQQIALVERLAATKKRWELHATLALLATGLRASELQHSSPRDWHPAEGWLQVHGGKTSNARRKAPCPPCCARIVDAGVVFGGKGNYAQRLGHALRALWDELGFKVTVHQLRHSAASNWRRAGRYSIEQVADYLGHADMSFTRSRYSKAGQEAESFPEIRKRYQRLLEWIEGYQVQ